MVTGATGWLGRALLAALADPTGPQRRRCVRARDVVGRRRRTRRPARGAAGARRRCTTSGLDALFEGLPPGDEVDVIHAAGVIHPATTSDWVEVNVRGTANVAAARVHAVRRMVHVSSNSPFGTNPDRTDVFRNDEPYAPALGYGR